MNTSIRQKKELWPKFMKACESQWMCGGDRYALAKDKEFTDLICEAVGNEWIGGNIIKYVGEIKNTSPKPEVDFFKIAVWAFIYWIKERENITERDKGEEFDDGDVIVRDPVYYDDVLEEWYFWDRKWTVGTGPYGSEKEARDAHTDYCKEECKKDE